MVKDKVKLWEAIDRWARARYSPGEKNIARAMSYVVEVEAEVEHLISLEVERVLLTARSPRAEGDAL